MKNVNSKFIIIIFIMISFYTIGCYATMQIPEVSVGHISEYKTYHNQEELEISIDPIFEEDRLKQFFGIDLLSYNTLPVLVIIKNNGNQPILIQKEDILLFNDDNKPIAQISPSLVRAPIEKEKREKEEKFTKILIFFPISMVAIPYFQKKSDDYNTILLNINKKTLLEKGIYHDELHYGFVYFFIKDKDDVKNIATLQVKVESLLSKDISTFMFDINRRILTR